MIRVVLLFFVVFENQVADGHRFTKRLDTRSRRHISEVTLRSDLEWKILLSGREPDAFIHGIPLFHELKCQVTSEEGVVATKVCRLEDEESINEKGVACMAIWSEDGTVVKQDCWIAQHVSLPQCSSRCDAQSNNGGFMFCCCFGDNCNTAYGPSRGMIGS